MIRVAALARFMSAPTPAAPGDGLRSGIGALIGIALTAALSSWWLGPVSGLPLLIAPMGASSVLLFAVPASPLAQPRALIGGNVVSALVGVIAARFVPDATLAAALAVGVAIVAMAATRCLHPPSGAVALTAVLGGPHVVGAGYWFVVVPVLLNSAILLVVAVVYNHLMGRSYPHIAHAVAHPDPAPPRIALGPADYAAVIADYGERLTIGADDLERLFEELTARNARVIRPGRPPGVRRSIPSRQ